MDVAPSMHNDSSQLLDTPSLFQHQMKPEWGLAVLLWEREAKRAYRFEDGRVRVFKRGYFKLMREVDAAADRTRRLVAAVERARGAAPPEASRTSRPPQPNRAITIDEQIAYFTESFDGGFSGDGWRAAHRGGGKGHSTLKRHRDSAVARAQEMLAREQLDDIIAGQRWDDGIAALSEVVGKTDLVTAPQRKLLDGLSDSSAQALVEELHTLLYGDQTFGIRFERWISALSAALGKAPPWQLATVPLALVYPEEHVCVRPTTFKAQAVWMAPRLALGKNPGAPRYERALDMARRVHARLADSELAPTDLLDVHDFMTMTLRPKAQEEMRERRRAARRVSIPGANSAPTLAS